MDRTEARERAREAPVARLATIRPDGAPHIVPVTFALDEGIVATMVDHKPKTTTRLQRLANIGANQAVSLLVDDWSDDWDRLWWVRLDGTASIHFEDDDWHRARSMLQSKYLQYRDTPPEGPAIVIEVENVTGWASSG